MKSIDFQLQPQLCNEWCWASVAAAICVHFKDSPCLDQRAVAELVLGNGAGDCPCGCSGTDDSELDCNRQQNLSAVLSEVRHLGEELSSPPCFDEITQEIDNEYPIAVVLELSEPAASGHAVAIYGYGDDDVVQIADPLLSENLHSASLGDLVQGVPPYQAVWQTAYRTIPKS